MFLGIPKEEMDRSVITLRATESTLQQTETKASLQDTLIPERKES